MWFPVNRFHREKLLKKSRIPGRRLAHTHIGCSNDVLNPPVNGSGIFSFNSQWANITFECIFIQEFNFEMNKVDMEQYYSDWWQGIKKYALKDPMCQPQQAQQQQAFTLEQHE